MSTHEQRSESVISFDQISEKDRIRVVYTNPSAGYDVVGTVTKVTEGKNKVVRIDVDSEYHDTVGIQLILALPGKEMQFYKVA